MCAIVGFAGRDDKLLKKMADSMAHRGPDGEGLFGNPFVSLAHRRLTIIDTSNDGNQPMHSADGRYTLVFNGEIYNYRELRQQLKKAGHTFISQSDTEVILVGYQEWGEKLLGKLLGMFAFAIYDTKHEELFVARDRLGIKPLYYVESPRFAFASEIKSLMLLPEVKKTINSAALARFLQFRVHDSDEQTFFGGVKRLLPGHYLRYQKGKLTTKRYWHLAWNPDFSGGKSDDEYAADFATLFERVMKRHLISDVPLGFNLSGGLDSSGVVAVAADLVRRGAEDIHTKGKLYTFSALFPNQSIDESYYIHEVERWAKSTPVYSYPKPDEFWAEVMDWVYTQEEPTISSAPYAYYSVFREASKHVKVSLSGNGGDEILAGYLPYFRTYLQSAIDSGHYGRMTSELVRGIPIFYRQYLQRLGDMFLSRPQPMQPFLGLRLEGFKKEQFNYSRNLNERLSQDVTRYSTPNLLRYEDKNSMAFGIESRVPFLDSELVEFVFSLPIDQKIKKGWTRYVYRNAMKGRMPELNRLRRSKIGFTNPEVAWLKHNEKPIREIFASSELAGRGLFAQEFLLESFDRWMAGNERIDPLVYWRILISELWIRRFDLNGVD